MDDDQSTLFADPDDPVHDVEAVWHGPRGKTLPWSARYQTYALGLSTYLGILLVEFAIGLQLVGWPITEIGVTFFICFGLMKIVDYERPLKAHVPTFLAEARRMTRRRPGPVKLTLALRVEQGHRRNWWVAKARAVAAWIDSRRKPPTDPPAPSAPAEQRRPTAMRRVRISHDIEKARHRLNLAVQACARWLSRLGNLTARGITYPLRLVHANPADMGFLLVSVGFGITIAGYWAFGQLGGPLSYVR